MPETPFQSASRSPFHSFSFLWMKAFSPRRNTHPAGISIERDSKRPVTFSAFFTPDAKNAESPMCVVGTKWNPHCCAFSSASFWNVIRSPLALFT